MKKGSRVLIIILLAACVCLGAYLVVSLQPAERPGPAPPPPRPAEAPKKVKIYRVAVENNQPELRATETDVRPGENPMEASLRRLIEQGDTADLANPIPKGTRLLGLKVKDGLATVNLSREFRDNFSGGSEAERLTIGAILRTLGQFPKVKRVLFLVEGKPLDTLGHLDLSGPQEVSWAYGDNN
ncbi:MAG TPA: GerMN domain-containing protein [Armatimonadota bacterium]|nr:GerMN domain-containing protein [Armatimonadota bacterium]